jgi:pyruvate dehydrogenase E2 component (dihydrolipoamide acetyltransferase)
MKINVAMPQLGESVSEGEVIRWLKRAGDAVRRDEALVEVKTDKATVEIPAPSSGTLSEILVEEGGTVHVGANIATIESTSAAAALAVEGAAPTARRIEPAVTRQEKKPVQAPPEAMPVVKSQPATRPAGKPATSPAVKPPPRAPSGSVQLSATRPQMTPLARRIASEFGLDPSKIRGTGEGGRITREDVLNAQASAVRPSNLPVSESPDVLIPQPPAEPAASQTEEPAQATGGEDEVVALSPIRRRIAARLVQSSQTIPRVTTAIEADMTALAELRKKHRESYEKAGIKLTYMPFIMKATIEALRETPAVNASWGGEKLILHKRVHLSVAVSVEGGLVVPVIRNADEMSVRQLAEKLVEIADHARAGRLAADEVRGGTFTITNPGLFGAVFSTPIINPPEAAILAVCRIAETPVARQGQVVIRWMTNLALSYDHRIIDGELAIQFLQHIRAMIEAAKFEMG